MRNSDHIHHYQRHLSISYPVSRVQKLYSIFLGPLIVVAILFVAARFLAHGESTVSTLSFNTLLSATGYTLVRLLVAYLLALIVSIPLALLATSSALVERLFLPLFDVLESIPILAFFPILILVFIKFDFLNGAAIFIIFLSMLWNIVFTVVGGLKVIPKDIIAAAHVFKIRGWYYVTKVLLPAIFPQVVTGSILAVGQGWNIIIVAEALHIYIPGGTAAQDLFGIGSILVGAASQGQNDLFISAIIVMVLAIALLNFFVWQKLLHYAQRFKFE